MNQQLQSAISGISIRIRILGETESTQPFICYYSLDDFTTHISAIF